MMTITIMVILIIIIIIIIIIKIIISSNEILRKNIFVLYIDPFLTLGLVFPDTKTKHT